MKYITVYLLLFSFLGSTSAAAGFVDGNELHKWAENEKQSDDWSGSLMLLGYIQGVVDTAKGTLCVPTGAMAGEHFINAKKTNPKNPEVTATDFMASDLFERVKGYIQENPEKWHMMGPDIVVETLKPSFGCKTSRQATKAFVDGYKLQKWDSSGGLFEFELMGFLQGVVDTSEDVVCFPGGVKLGQLDAIVSKFIKNNPENWHKAASGLVIEALKPTFSCNRRK